MFTTLNTSVSAQRKKVVVGQLKDHKSQQPVPFATLRFSQADQGLVASAEGEFQIRIDDNLRADTLIISCIGYRTDSIALQRLRLDTVNIVELSPSVTKLSEVTVTADRGKLSARRIVRQSLRRITNNYPDHPSSYVAYYRDYQQEGEAYLNVNEALLKVFDPGFDTHHHTNVAIALLEYRKNRQFPRDSLTSISYDNRRRKLIPGANLTPFGGNELSVLYAHDALRNYKYGSYSYVYTLKEDFVKNHRFVVDSTVYLANTPLLKISFFAKSSIIKPGYEAKGSIYIAPEDYAIHKLVYTTYKKDIDSKQKVFTVQVEYKQIDGLMYLNYISFSNMFQVQVKDISPFRVTDIGLDRDDNVLILSFSDTPDTSAFNKSNYKIKWGNQILDVERAIPYLTQGVALCLKKAVLNEKNGEHKVAVDIVNVTDTKGRAVHKRTYKTVHQFRELFVQKVFPRDKVPSGNKFIKKNAALSSSEADTRIGDPSAYWMNTPLAY